MRPCQEALRQRAKRHSLLIGCDTGGTFTDFVMFDPLRPEQGLATYKLSSTPDDPSRAILEGIAYLTQGDGLEELCHATTVATNCLLEGTGGRVGLLTTQGFADNLWLGRGDRAELFSLRPHRVQPPLQRDDVWEVHERADAQGQILTPLDPAEVERLLKALRHRQSQNDPIDAWAICLLHASLQPCHERQLAEALQTLGQPVYASHQIAPAPGEYERGMTTVLAATLAPKIDAYLERLESGLQKAQLWIVHSAGGLLRTAEARQAPHRLALSGPAAGLRGALSVGQVCGQDNLITMDIGGTSSDVALCHDGHLPYLWESEIEGFPLLAPSLEIHTIGAGGGSIAYLDSGGFLRVGPRSAGAVPGPACYGRGGQQATVTDALCWAGYLPSSLGGDQLQLDREASQKALAHLAKDLNLSVDATALGILAIAVGHLGLAVRKVSTGRGHDPSAFSLFPFGGAGPMLACQVADSLQMDTILVPASAGVLSAWGALTAPWEREWSAPVPSALRQDAEVIEQLFLGLEELAAALRLDEGFHCQRLLARRYRGQGDTLVSEPQVDFHSLHQQRFGFQREQTAVETTEVRLRCRGPQRTFAPSTQSAQPWKQNEERLLLSQGGSNRVPVFQGSLAPQQSQAGPFLHFSAGSTLLVGHQWTAHGLPGGHILLRRSSSEQASPG